MKHPVPGDDAVRKATGKGWEEWFELLDDEGMRDKTHKQIAQWLSEQKLISSEWYVQTIVVAYEYHHGKRELGQTSDAGYQVGVMRSISISQDDLWRFLVSPQGIQIWLGDTELVLEKGAAYETDIGTKGEVRSVNEGKKLRLTWQPAGRNSSTLQIYLLPQKDKVSLGFHHEKLSGPDERNFMKQHWQEVLENIKDELFK